MNNFKERQKTVQLPRSWKRIVSSRDLRHDVSWPSALTTLFAVALGKQTIACAQHLDGSLLRVRRHVKSFEVKLSEETRQKTSARNGKETTTSIRYLMPAARFGASVGGAGVLT
jgi:hypothetical protein